MLKKKTTSKPNDHDFSALDAAVSELSKQTEALLGKAESTPKKPALPKKHSRPQLKGKSFDIIHPSVGQSTPATLKVARAKKIDANKSEEHLLLPDHAGKSYNEIPPEVDLDKLKRAEIKNVKSSAVIQTHESSRLAASPPEEQTLESENKLPKKEATATEPEPKDPGPTFAVSHTAPSLKIEPDKEKTEKVDETASKSQASSAEAKEPETETVASEEDRVKTDEETFKLGEDDVPEPTTYDSGELFANNLVKDTKRKGYKPVENQQKPTVFDTNEYHPQLHDWSKLEHRGSWRWIFLLALLVVAAGLGYMVVSGRPIPFIQ